MGSHITPDDVRRAARMVVALYEKDHQVLDLVTREVHAARRWMQHGMSCALVARTALVQIDEDERDEGALALWLHSAVEQTISDEAAWWWSNDDDDGDE
jgi:hypothetical protein